MNDRRKRFNIRLYFSLLIVLIFVMSIVVSGGLMLLISRIFSIEYDAKTTFILWFMLTSFIISSTITVILSKRILTPVTRLSEALNKVAKGDFSVRLTEKSGISEIQDSYQSFNTMAKELSATETLQTDFISNVSHEFKTPLNAIEGYATLLQNGDDLAQEQSEYIDKIMFNTRRLSELVGNILLLSKLENQNIPVKKTRYRLDEQLRQAIVALEQKWTEKNIDFEIDMDEVYFTGTEALMLHVWMNLLDNAIKFSPQGGQITIELKRVEDRIIFNIGDEGCGVGEEARKRIFDRFYQEDVSHRSEGNGLGLALAKHILSSNNGDIGVENLPKRGCVFTVSLPAEVTGHTGLKD